MKILGIDPALAVTGYGVIDVVKNKIVLLEAGIIKTSAKESSEQRLKAIYEGVDNLILVEYGWGYDPANVPEYKSRMIVNKPKDLLKAVEKFS